jgi:hypothetical protein
MWEVLDGLPKEIKDLVCEKIKNQIHLEEKGALGLTKKIKVQVTDKMIQDQKN